MIERPNGTSEANQTKRHWHDHAAVWAAISAALAAVAAAAAGTYQGHVASQALAIAREANETAVRPYIKAKFAKTESFVIPFNGPGPAAVPIFVENTGKMPALIYLESAIDYQGGKHNGDDRHWPEIDGTFAKRFIFPGDGPIELTSTSLILSPGTIVDMKGEQATLFVMADVFYGPQRKFETHICSQFHMSGTIEFRLSGEKLCPSPNSNYAK